MKKLLKFRFLKPYKQGLRGQKRKNEGCPNACRQHVTEKKYQRPSAAAHKHRSHTPSAVEERTMLGNTQPRLTRHVNVAVQGFDGVVEHDPPPVVHSHFLVNVQTGHRVNVAAPLDGSGFLSVEPEFGERGGEGSKKLRQNLGDI